MYFGIWGLTGFIHVQCVWFLLLVYICMYVGWDLGFGSLRPRVVFLFMCRNHVIVWFITLILARMLRNVIKLMPLGSMIILGVEGFWVLQEYSYSCTSTSIMVLHMTIRWHWQTILLISSPRILQTFNCVLEVNLIGFVNAECEWLCFFCLFMYVECDFDL
jgi:hypothetical protein